MKINSLKTLFLAALTVFTFASCEVDGDVSTDIDSGSQDSFKDLVVASTFEWTTTNDYTINFKGLPISTANVKMPLIIKIQGGDVLRKVNIGLSEDIDIDVSVPSRFQTLELSWGTFEKTLTLGDNSNVDFTFIEVNPVVGEDEE
jgi:hypothetical protein